MIFSILLSIIASTLVLASASDKGRKVIKIDMIELQIDPLFDKTRTIHSLGFQIDGALSPFKHFYYDFWMKQSSVDEQNISSNNLYCILEEEEVDDYTLRIKDSLDVFSEMKSNLLTIKQPIYSGIDLFFFNEEQQLFSYKIDSHNKLKFIEHKQITFSPSSTLINNTSNFKLIQWREYILCANLKTVSVIMGDNAYVIIELESIHDIKVIEDNLVIAGGEEGAIIYQLSFPYSDEIDTTFINHIQVTYKFNFKWQGKSITQITVYQNQIVFISHSTLFLYSLSSNVNFNYICSFDGYQEIDQVQMRENILVILFKPSLVYKMYSQFKHCPFQYQRLLFEYYVQFNQNNPRCQQKVKQLGCLSQSINEIKLSSQFIYLISPSKITQIKSYVSDIYLKDKQNNYLTQYFYNKIQAVNILEHFQNEELIHPNLLIISSSHIQILEMNHYELQLNCDSNKQIEMNFSIQMCALFCSQIEFPVPFIIQENTPDNQLLFDSLCNAQQFNNPSTSQDACLIQIPVQILQTNNLLPYSEQSERLHIIGVLSSCCFFILIYIFYLFLTQKQIIDKQYQNNKRVPKVNNQINEQILSFSQLGNGTQTHLNLLSPSNKRSDASIGCSSPVCSPTNNSKSNLSFGDNKISFNQQVINLDMNNFIYDPNKNTIKRGQNHSNENSPSNNYIKNKQNDNAGKDFSYLNRSFDDPEEIKRKILLNQINYQQFIQQVVNDPQFKLKNRSEQENIIQSHYQQLLEYQRHLKIQLIQKGCMNYPHKKAQKFIDFKQQNEFDPIMETDSDKKMSTRRELKQFSKVFQNSIKSKGSKPLEKIELQNQVIEQSIDDGNFLNINKGEEVYQILSISNSEAATKSQKQQSKNKIDIREENLEQKKQKVQKKQRKQTQPSLNPQQQESIQNRSFDSQIVSFNKQKSCLHEQLSKSNKILSKSLSNSPPVSPSSSPPVSPSSSPQVQYHQKITPKQGSSNQQTSCQSTLFTSQSKEDLQKVKEIIPSPQGSLIGIGTILSMSSYINDKEEQVHHEKDPQTKKKEENQPLHPYHKKSEVEVVNLRNDEESIYELPQGDSIFLNEHIS